MWTRAAVAWAVCLAASAGSAAAFSAPHLGEHPREPGPPSARARRPLPRGGRVRPARRRMRAGRAVTTPSPLGGVVRHTAPFLTLWMGFRRTGYAVRPPAAAARAADLRCSRPSLSALRMGGGNVPRVPYKAPGEQGYQVYFAGLLGSRAERGTLRD